MRFIESLRASQEYVATAAIGCPAERISTAYCCSRRV
jgi:hypothetical protein